MSTAKTKAFERSELKFTRHVDRAARQYLEEMIPCLNSHVADSILLKSHKAGCGTELKALDWTNMVIEARTPNGIFVGFIAAHIEMKDERSALINMIFTDPKYRRRGVATLLRADLEEELLHLEISTVVAAPINRAALAWLENTASSESSIDYQLHVPCEETLDRGDQELIEDCT